MAEGVAFSIGEYLIPKLASIAADEIGLVYNCRDDLINLEDTLSLIKDVLLDAEELQEKSHFVRNRIKKLEEVLYDADDLLDDVATEDLRRKLDTKGKMARQVCDFFSSSNHLAFRRKMGHAIRDIRDRIDQISSDISKFNSISSRVIVNAQNGGDRERETDSFVYKPDVIGREREKNDIIKMLVGSGSNTKVIPIVGIGGLGKTAFAKLVFDDEGVVKQHFEPRIWVCVAEDFKKEVIVRNILRCITDTNEKVEDSNIEEMQKFLRKKLDGKRYLLVLDDVWNEDSEKWIQLERLLMVGANGTKIVVTTRSKKVASAMGVDSPFMLKGLTDEQSWELFVKLAFREELDKVDKKIIASGQEIIKRCKGIPLAIRTLGSTMRSKTKESEWLYVQNNEIWLSSTDDGGILSVLRLSYDQLPSHLKNCFAYCSIFPKDYEIDYEVLIQLWMAQGFVQSPSKGGEKLESIGDRYFKDLLSVSFLQDVELDEYGNITSVKMHDLIHDLAKQVVNTNYEKFRHVFFQGELSKIPNSLLQKKSLRTFLTTSNGGREVVINYMLLFSCMTNGVFDTCIYYEIFFNQGTIISNFRCLRVLTLGNCDISKIRGSIGALKHLRYLDLSDNWMRSLPNSISKLLNLQTLKLSNCRWLKKLPRCITKLINLRYLITKGCDELEHMPSGLERLTSLQKLSMFVVGGEKKKKWTVSGGGQSSGGLRLRELEKLNELRGILSIKHLERIRLEDVSKASMKEKQYLERLELGWDWRGTTGEQKAADLGVLEGLEPHPNVRELKIDGFCAESFASWMMNYRRSNLVKISIESCRRCQQLPPLDLLPFLKFLSLRKLDALECIQIQEQEEGEEDFYDALESIQQEEEEEDLYDDDNHNKKKNQEEEVVRDGQKATTTSSSSSSSALLLFFPSLQELELDYLPKLKGWSVWRRRSSSSEEEEEFTSSSSSLVFPKLTKLFIRDCPMLTSMPLYPNLEELNLERVREKLLRERLTITTTTSTTTAAEETKGVVSHHHHHHHHHQQNSLLSKLKSLSLCLIKDLEAMPTECLHNLTSLERLTIYCCNRLLCLSTSSSSSSSSGQGDGGQVFRDLSTSLRFLRILYCDKLKSLSKELRHLTALETLDIRFCEELDLSDDDDDGMHWQGLSSLRTLDIYTIPKLVNLPVGIQHLTTLQQLTIWSCKEFVDVPEWIGNLSQLQRLKFYDSPKLSSLPQGMCRLTSLQFLTINKCPNLTPRCRKETGDDWPKIAHIPNINIDYETIQGRDD